MAQDIVPPKVSATTPLGVNVSDRSYQLSVTDLSVGEMTLSRYTLPPTNEANRPVNDSFLGAGLGLSFDIYVAPNFIKPVGAPWYHPSEYHPIVHMGNSASGVYVQSSITGGSINSLNFEAEKGTLAMVSGAYVYTSQDGTIHTFNPSVQAGGTAGQYSQRIAKIEYPDGRVETFTYNASKQLKLVSDNTGNAIVLDYNAAGDVSEACGFRTSQVYVSAASTCAGAALKVTYGYNTSLLTSVTDVLGKTTTYGRSTDLYGHTITCIKPPLATECQISNSVGVTGRVGAQTTADGSTWGAYSDWQLANDPEAPMTTYSGSLTDPANRTTSFQFTASSPTWMRDPNMKVTTFEWTGSVLQQPWYDQTPNGSFLVSATYPEGNKYLAEYVGPYKAISKETVKAKPGGGPDLVKQYVYGSCSVSPGTRQNCTKPIAIIDPKGNRTDYSYASHGGILTEMAPAPSTNAARPLKVTTWAQRYAWVKNSSGTLVQAATPVWVKASETQCQTATGSNPAAICDGSAQQSTTTYEYGATGTAESLLVKGVAVSSDGTTLRSCYLYDSYARRMSETKPNAGLTSCP